MNISHKTFRVFLSSTFADMSLERDLLDEYVYPELTNYCRNQGFEFQAIDLRWGVNDEAGYYHKTLNICIEEVRKCKTYPKPNFMILLGDRYGWVPLPTIIENKEYELLYGHIEGSSKQELISKWYKLDTNEYIPSYVLLHREGEYLDKIKWEQEETIIREVMQNAVQNIPDILLAKSEKKKYFQSATEIEIEHGLFMDNEKHNIHFFDREIIDLESSTNDFTEHGFFIDTKSSDNKYSNVDTYKRNSLSRLKDRIRRELQPDYINKFCVEKQKIIKLYKLYVENGQNIKNIPMLGYALDFCAEVKKSLLNNIVEQIKKIQIISKEEINRREQRNYLEKKTCIVEGREKILSEIKFLIKLRNKHFPLVILGEHGIGKTSLIGKAILNLKVEYDVVYRFVGASGGTTSPCEMLRSLCFELNERYCLGFALNLQLSSDASTQYSQLSHLLGAIIGKLPDKKLIIVIDGLNKYINLKNVEGYEWLKYAYKQNISVILSTVPDDLSCSNLYDVISNVFHKDAFLTVGPISEKTGQLIVKKWCELKKRNFTPEQSDYLLNFFIKTGSPLHLMIALSQAIGWRSFDQVKHIELGNTLHESIQVFFNNLTSIKNHSETLVKHTLLFLAFSKQGLTEKEIIDLLSGEPVVISSAGNEYFKVPCALPFAVWARFNSDISDFFLVQDVDDVRLILFEHNLFKKIASKQNCNGKTEGEIREALLNYFLKIYESNKTSMRALIELPFQLVKLGALKGDLSKAQDFLTEREFIEAKQNKNELALMDDFNYYLDLYPDAGSDENCQFVFQLYSILRDLYNQNQGKWFVLYLSSRKNLANCFSSVVNKEKEVQDIYALSFNLFCQYLDSRNISDESFLSKTRESEALTIVYFDIAYNYSTLLMTGPIPNFDAAFIRLKELQELIGPLVAKNSLWNYYYILCLVSLAECYFKKGIIKEATKCIDYVLENTINCYSQLSLKTEEYIQFRLNASAIIMLLGEHEKVIIILNDLIKGISQLKDANPTKWAFTYINSVYRLSCVYLSLNKHEMAITILNDLIKDVSHLIEANPSQLAYIYLESVYQLSDVYLKINDYKEATTVLEKVVCKVEPIIESEFQPSSFIYGSQDTKNIFKVFTRSLNSLSALYGISNRFNEAKIIMDKAERMIIPFYQNDPLQWNIEYLCLMLLKRDVTIGLYRGKTDYLVRFIAEWFKYYGIRSRNFLNSMNFVSLMILMNIFAGLSHFAVNHYYPHFKQYDNKILGVAFIINICAILYRRIWRNNKTENKAHPFGRRYIGRTFILENPIVKCQGSLKIEDIYWKISGPDTLAFSKIVITGVQNNILFVKPEPILVNQNPLRTLMS